MSEMRENPSLKKQGEKREQGSMTVESVLLIPVIIYVLMFLLYLMFYYFEYGLVQSEAEQRIVPYLDEIRREGQEGIGSITEELERSLKDALFFARDVEVKTVSAGQYLQISIAAAERIPFGEIVSMLGTSTIWIEQQVTVVQKDPVDILRKEKLLEEEGIWKKQSEGRE